MSMRRLMVQAAGGLVIAFGPGVSGTLHAQGQDADQAFITKVAASNLLEVRLGQAAQKQAENAAVKQFAQRMVIDHTSMQKQWMAAAKKNDLEFKADLTPEQLQQAYRLRDLRGNAFDRAYMDAMVQNHRDNVSSFQTERNAGHSADVRQLIESSLPALQEHLTTSQQVARQVGSGIATSGGTPADTTPVTQAPQTTVGQPRQTTAVVADSAFIRQVEASNTAEIWLAQLAQRKASDPQVKQFAQKVITDHNGLKREWGAIASTSGLRISGAIDPRHQEQFTRLNRLSGTEFDRAFMAAMVENHQESVRSLQTKGRTAQSPQVRQQASRSLGAIEEHLNLAQQIARQVGADTTTTIANADSAFIREVEASNTAEIRLAQLAGRKASDSQVKQFAQKMITDHNGLQREWDNIASTSGFRIGGTIDQRRQEQLTRLERLSGNEFDRAFMAAMVENHQENMRSLQTKGRSAQSPQVRQQASRSLGAIEEHLNLAQQISRQVGADTTTTIAGEPPQGPKGDIKKDYRFIRNVDADHFLEIRLARLAEEKARNSDVKQFARRMNEDHTSLQKQWTAMASNNGLNFKSGMGPRHRSKLTRLEKLSGRQFDREYMTLVAQNHQDYLDYFRKEGRAANSAPVRQLVNRGIPVLEQHLRQAKQVGVRVGADTTTSRVGRISATQR